MTRKLKWKGKTTLGLDLPLLSRLPGFFKVCADGQLEDYNMEVMEKLRSEFTQDVTEILGNNEKIYRDDDDVQKLTHDDIMTLKQERQGEEIIELVKRNNANFEQRTEFSKKKYLEKKAKKYTLFFHIEAVSIHALNLYYMNKQGSYYFPREDYLAYLLNNVHPRPNDSLAVIEKTKGVVAAAMLQRTDASNKLHVLNAAADFSINKHLEAVQLLELTEEGKQRMQLESLETFLAAGSSVDFLVVVADVNMPVLLERISPNLRYNCKIVMFNRNYEIVKAAFDYLLRSDEFIRVDVRDYAYREYQVLPMRTHPEMRGNLASGYFVTATRIKPFKRDAPN